MPCEFNESRRHKIPIAQYRVANWPEYDAALVQRGSLTIWFNEEAMAAWHAPATGARGGQPIYPAMAIETASHSAWFSTSRSVKQKGCFVRSPMCRVSPLPYRIIRRSADEAVA